MRQCSFKRRPLSPSCGFAWCDIHQSITRNHDDGVMRKWWTDVNCTSCRSSQSTCRCRATKVKTERKTVRTCLRQRACAPPGGLQLVSYVYPVVELTPPVTKSTCFGGSQLNETAITSQYYTEPPVSDHKFPAKCTGVSAALEYRCASTDTHDLLFRTVEMARSLPTTAPNTNIKKPHKMTVAYCKLREGVTGRHFNASLYKIVLVYYVCR